MTTLALPLREDDPSREKILALHDRLVEQTSRGALRWDQNDEEEFTLALPSGAVEVGSGWVAIFDDNGAELRRIREADLVRPGFQALRSAIFAWRRDRTMPVIDAILAELAELGASL